MKKFLSLLVVVLILMGLVGCSSSKTTDETSPRPVVQGKLPALSAEEAKAIALEHAGVTADQVASLNTKYQVEDYVPMYIVEFQYDDQKFEYTIHGDSGEILVYGKNPIVDPEDKPNLSQNTVRDIALKHSGAGRNDAQNMEIEYEVSNGLPVYLVEFRVGSFQLKYKIHAQTGEILNCEKSGTNGENIAKKN